MSNSLELRLVSITDNEVYRIQGNTRRGIVLNGGFTWNKIGGLRSFEVTISRDSEMPSFPGMRLEFYFRDEVYGTLNKIFTGFVKILPTPENNEKTITFEGTGYVTKFEERLLSQTYLNASIEDVINSLDYSGLDLDLTANSVSPPVINISEITFSDKTYVQVFNTLLQIANNDITNDEYVWGIDENRGIYFKRLPSVFPDVKKKYFEGYHFQDPSVEFDDDVINKLTVFRATKVDPKETELVNTYEDSSSQDQYGVREKKLTISDYTDDSSIALIADSILQDKKEPTKVITIDNFFIKDGEVTEGNIILDDNGTIFNMQLDDNSVLFNTIYRNPVVDDLNYFRVLEADYYGISNKPQEKHVLVNECDSLGEWTLSVPNSTIVEDDINVMTGRQSFKWTRDPSQVSGDYIEFELEDRLHNPISVLFMLYFAGNASNITFSFYDSEGRVTDIEFDSSDERINTWLKITDDSVNLSGAGPELLQINDTGPTPSELLEINDGVEDTNMFIGADAGLRDLTKVRITLGIGTAEYDEVYIDRIQLKNKAWSYSRLSLDNAQYRVTKDFIIGELEFGNKKASLVDEIKDKLSRGDTAYDLYTRS